MQYHSNSMGFESGKNGGRNGYRREFRKWDAWQPERGGGFDVAAKDRAASGGESGSKVNGRAAGVAADRGAESRPLQSFGTTAQISVADLEKRLSCVQEDFTQKMQKNGETENEKFDLIFAILVELQSRQAQLEESVRLLNAQYGGGTGGQMAPSGSRPEAAMAQNPQSPMGQFGGGCSNCSNSGGQQNFGQMSGQMNGQMSGQMNSPMNGQQPMQQFTGVMQADGSQAMYTAVPQTVVVVASPSANGMQYAMPQMMFPNGAMQPMSMQYMGPGANSEMGGFVGNQAGPASGSEQHDAGTGDHQAQRQGDVQQPMQPMQPQQMQPMPQQQMSSNLQPAMQPMQSPPQPQEQEQDVPQPQPPQQEEGHGTPTGNAIGDGLAPDQPEGSESQQADHCSSQPSATPE